jgi:hypothetical protein
MLTAIIIQPHIQQDLQQEIKNYYLVKYKVNEDVNKDIIESSGPYTKKDCLLILDATIKDNKLIEGDISNSDINKLHMFCVP